MAAAKQGRFYWTIYTVIITVGILAFIIYQIQKHVENNTWQLNNGYVIALGAPAIVMLLGASAWVGFKEREFGGPVMTAMGIVFCSIIVIFTNIIASGFKGTFQVVGWEKAMFYVSIGGYEEFMYRLMLMTSIAWAFNSRRAIFSWCLAIGINACLLANAFQPSTALRAGWLVFATVLFLMQGFLPRREIRSVMADIVGVVVSSAQFSIAHYQVYGQTEPAMMVATAITGATMAIFYAWTRNIAVPMVAHMANNFLASIQLVLMTVGI